MAQAQRGKQRQQMDCGRHHKTCFGKKNPESIRSQWVTGENNNAKEQTLAAPPPSPYDALAPLPSYMQT